MAVGYQWKTDQNSAGTFIDELYIDQGWVFLCQFYTYYNINNVTKGKLYSWRLEKKYQLLINA